MNSVEDFLICLRKLSDEELFCLEKCIEKVREERHKESIKRVADGWAYGDEAPPLRNIDINALPLLTDYEIFIAHARGRLQTVREYRNRTHTGLLEAATVVDNYMRGAGLIR